MYFISSKLYINFLNADLKKKESFIFKTETKYSEIPLVYSKFKLISLNKISGHKQPTTSLHG